MKKFLLLFPLFFSGLVYGQGYRLVSIPVDYSYEFNNGFADGSGTCTSCWTYAGRRSGIVLTQTGEDITAGHFTTENEVAVSFYEWRSKTVNHPFESIYYCNNPRYKTKDEFTGKNTMYCMARVNREDRMITPGTSIIYGNAASKDLDDPDNAQPLSFMKVWMLPEVQEYNQTLGYCESLFTASGVDVPDGYWEYISDEATQWLKLDGNYASRYPLDITLEQLDQSTTTDLRRIQFLKLRFVLLANGSGSFHGLNTSSASGSRTEKGEGQHFLGPYSFNIFRCSPELTAPPLVQNILCHGDGNGSFSLQFSRALYAPNEEKMLIMLYRVVGSEFHFVESRILEASDLLSASWSWPPELSPGTYQVRWMTKEGGDARESIPDAIRESLPFNVSEPETLTGRGEVLPVVCRGGNTGEIKIHATGGIPPYKYAIDGGEWQSDPDFQGLSAGTYTLYLKDAHHCTTQLTVAVEEPLSIPEVQVLLASDPTANGASDGFITVDIKGGSGSYRYHWTHNGNFFSDRQNLKNLGGALYNLVVTDSKGCESVSYGIELTEPDPLGLTFLSGSDSLDCAGGYTVLRAQGTGSASEWDNSYSYLWDHGVTGPVLTEAGAGTYRVTVSDKYGNSFSAAHTIDAPPPILIQEHIAHVSCKGLKNGKIALEISGGVAPYRVVWNKWGSPGFVKEGTLADELAPGYYVYEITDANGCSVDNTSLPVLVEEPSEELRVSDVFIEEIGNADLNNGSISVRIAGGTPPYMYEWIGPDGFMASQPDISGLTQGVYTLLVRDQNAGGQLQLGCFIIEEFSLTAPDPLEVTLETLLPVRCHGENNAVIRAMISGGTSPFNIQWYRLDSGGVQDLSGGEDILEELSDGGYYARIEDAKGQHALSDTLFIARPPVLEITRVSVIKAKCKNGNDGRIALEVRGGVPPYTISWDNGKTGALNNGLSPGRYLATVKDSNGCEMQAGFDVGYENNLELILEEVQDPLLVGSHDGMIKLHAMGGVPPYTLYLNEVWVARDANGEFLIADLSAGDYGIVVVDNAGCEATVGVALADPGLVDFEVTAPSCPGFCDGTILVKVNQPETAALEYLWESGSTANYQEGLCPGLYSVQVNGLLTGSAIFQVEIPETEDPLSEIPEEVILCSESAVVLEIDKKWKEEKIEWWRHGRMISDQPTVMIDQGGIYEVKLDLGNCIFSKSIEVIATETVMKAEFVMASHVVSESPVWAIDVTTPIPEEVEWYLPQNSVIEEQTKDGIAFRISEPGTYEIGMRVRNGDCESTLFKTLVVTKPELEAETNGTHFDMSIEEVLVYPNPAVSHFYLELKLKSEASLHLKVYSLANNQLVARLDVSGQQDYRERVDLSMAPPGIYAVLIEIPGERRVYKLVKS
ncbi:T9SS type A sorting domain-containing protein [Robertkochia flava]|uniref:T9SS type A sorting domain-containing protein n=1 Tax=Robertkochia flava TaxID=3447986 RepID=UPI001CCB56CA|nr:T9SS type A sorting domain-containing protein [Robertkochia marina]